MCRHLAYVGPPATAADWLLDAPNCLVRQAWVPRRQRHGVVNADGFGLGWYAASHSPPLRHRGGGPVWQDETFADVARSQRVVGLVASVRSATASTAFGTAAAMPFRGGRWLFAHNGALHGWPDAAVPLAAELGLARLLRLEAMTDAALLWALILDLLERGVPADKAVTDVILRAHAACGGRLNLLLTDGEQVIATCWGASLSVRGDVVGPGAGVLVASEPLDHDPRWCDVPDRSVVRATGQGIQITSLSSTVI